MQFKHFGKKLLKFLKNPKLAIPAAYIYYIMHMHGNELKIPLSCEGLISSPEAVYLYKTALGNRKKEGAILDFGSYKGLSTCILSWAGMKIGKSIIAFESFQGLPSQY